jgi:hypothetical protein
VYLVKHLFWAALFLTLQDHGHKFGGLTLYLTVEPGTPVAGDLVRVSARVGRDLTQALNISRATAMISRDPAPITVEVKALSKPGRYGFSFLADRPGKVKLDVDIELEDGTQTSAAREVDVAASSPRPDTMGPLWSEIHRAVEEGGGGIEEKLQRLRKIPVPAPKKFPQHAEEYRRLTDEFAAELDGLAKSFSREAFRHADLYSCTRCHLKFRWGVVSDLSRFPDLTDVKK